MAHVICLGWVDCRYVPCPIYSGTQKEHPLPGTFGSQGREKREMTRNHVMAFKAFAYIHIISTHILLAKGSHVVKFTSLVPTQSETGSNIFTVLLCAVVPSHVAFFFLLVAKNVTIYHLNNFLVLTICTLLCNRSQDLINLAKLKLYTH